MAWKKVTNADAGDATHFGGNDMDKISDLLSDVADIDTIKINSTWEQMASKFKIRDFTDESKEIVFNVASVATATTRTLTVPNKNLTLVGTVDKLDVFAATTSAELKTVISDETGTGVLVFGTSPTIVTPTIAATGWTNATHAHLAANSGGQITEASISDLGTYFDTAGTGLTSSGGTVNVIGTASRISVSANAIDIDSGYVGQASITTLGTIATGVWSGTTIVTAKIATTLTGKTLTTATIALGSNTVSGTAAEFDTAVTDDNFVFDGATNVITGAIRITAGTMRIPLSATPTISVDGDFAIDTTITDFSMGLIKYFDGEEMAVVAMPIAQLTTPTDGHAVKYNATTDEFELGAVAGASPLTTKGDVFTFDTADARLPVGTNGQILTADSAEALGVKWAAAGGTGDMVLADVQTVTGAKTFGTIGGAVGKFILAGSTSGSTIVNAAAAAGTTTATLQATTGTLALLGDKLDAFAATTSAELASVISNETGSGLLVFGTSPTIVTPTIAATGWTNANHAHLAANSGGTITEASISDLQSYLLNVVEDTTPQLGADLEMQGFNLQNGGVIFLKEQAEADADVAGEGQIWVDTQTPNKLFFTDDAGTDFDLTAGGASQTPIVADVDYDGFDIKDISNIEFRDSTALPLAGVAYIAHNGAGSSTKYNVPTGHIHVFLVNDVLQLTIGTSSVDFHANALLDGTLDLADITVTGSTAEFNTALQGDSFAVLTAEQNFITNKKHFFDAILAFRNPANTFDYTLQTGAIVANRDVILPVLTGNDTFVFEAHAQTLTGKTIDADGTGNVITNIGSSEIKSEMITGFGTVTAASGDFVLISDTTDSGNLKKIDAADFLGAGSQTPWVADIDADGFDLKDLSNIEFRTTTGAPASSVQAMYADAGGIIVNVPTGDTLDVQINAVSEFEFFATALNMKGNDLTTLGGITFDDTHTITTTASLLSFGIGTGDTFSFDINGTPEVVISSTVLDIQNNLLQFASGESIGMESNDMHFDVTNLDTFSFDINGIPELTIGQSLTTLFNDVLVDVGSNPLEFTLRFDNIVADDTELVRITFQGQDDAAAFEDYAKIIGIMESDVAASTQGSLLFSVIEANVQTTYIHLNDAGGNAISMFKPLDMNNNNITLGTGLLNFSTAGTSISEQSSDMIFDVSTGDFFAFDINGTTELAVNATLVDMQGNNLANAVTTSTVTGVSGITGLGTQTQDMEFNGLNIQTIGVLTLKEQAEADADVGGEGQLWVNTATPNELFFTDDAGTDQRLGLQSVIVSASDETTVLSTGTAKTTFRMPYAMNITEVRASLSTAGTGAALVTVDINEGGTTILSTKLTIDATEKTSTTAATAPVISDAALADDAEMTIDIDIVDTDNVAKGLKITLIGNPQ